MAAGDATATDVPGKYDVVINGKGYCFLDSLESSIPFRTHRAIYGQTQPFVERQNVSNSYGDNAQDFFQTIRQRDWSLGEQQKFFRAGADGRYWMGTNVDVRTPGTVSIRRQIKSVTFAAAVSRLATYGTQATQQIAASGATNLYSIAATSTITDAGAHGLGTTPVAMAGDGTYVYMSSTAAGTVGVRRWNGSVFATFSASGADALTFANNTLYGYRFPTNDLVTYDTSGTLTSVFTWKDAGGTAAISPTRVVLVPFGGKILILRQLTNDGSELWIYDGVGTSKLAEFPPSFVAWDMSIVYGVVFISGSFFRLSGSASSAKPAVLFFNNGTIGELWRANDYIATSDGRVAPHPVVSSFDGGLLFSDDTTGNFMFYTPSTGGVHSLGSYTVTGDNSLAVATSTFFLNIRNGTAAYFAPDGTTFASTATVLSSLIDFDSSLTKAFRGVRVDFDSATDGDGGTVDISYQLNSLTGSWTSLKTNATAGVEYTLPAATTGSSIAIKVTLNKSTSTSGPVLKNINVRGAPIMPVFPRGEYILDCTGTPESPRQLRDGSFHPLVGYDQVANLVTARNSTVPIVIIDKVNGTYTGFVDVNDQEGFDVYEVHPHPNIPTKPGSYVVRLTTRGV